MRASKASARRRASSGGSWARKRRKAGSAISSRPSKSLVARSRTAKRSLPRSRRRLSRRLASGESAGRNRSRKIATLASPPSTRRPSARKAAAASLLPNSFHKVSRAAASGTIGLGCRATTLATSQTSAVVSPLAEINRRPSDVNANWYTTLIMAGERMHGFAAEHVVEIDGAPPVTAAAAQPAAIGRHCKVASRWLFREFESPTNFTGRQLPKTQMRSGRGDQRTPIVREEKLLVFVPFTGERTNLAAGGQIDDSYLVGMEIGRVTTVGAERRRQTVFARRPPNFAARFQVPGDPTEFDGTLKGIGQGASGPNQQGRAIRGKVDRANLLLAGVNGLHQSARLAFIEQHLTIRLPCRGPRVFRRGSGR